MKRRRLTIILLILVLVAAWISIDINFSYKTDIRVFDAQEVARLDGAMWRSYYEKKKILLFWQSAKLLRRQFGVPFWRSNVMAYHAAKAAFIFKDGHNRAEYEKALPNLVYYYREIDSISRAPFDANKAAKLELEWWILRRSRQEHPPAEWEKLLALSAETVYHQPAEKFAPFAHWRTEAMLLRDTKGDQITDTDWQQVNILLNRAWLSFRNSFGNP